MPNVKIRVESVTNDEMSAQKQGQEVKGAQTGEVGKLAVASIFAQQAIGTAKSIVNTYVSNIGTFTGNYVKQDNVQRELDAVGNLATIGAAFATNWVAGIAMTVGIAIKGIADFTVQQKEIEIENQRIEYLRQRNGNTLTDGSRRR